MSDYTGEYMQITKWDWLRLVITVTIIAVTICLVSKGCETPAMAEGALNVSGYDGLNSGDRSVCGWNSDNMGVSKSGLSSGNVSQPVGKKGTEGKSVQRQSDRQAVERIADAIYLAEGGSKTKHPYGILKTYNHTSARQACINTINHALRDWDGKGDFIAFLGGRYAPIGAKNDPDGLNKNWVKNVKHYLYAKNDLQG